MVTRGQFKLHLPGLLKVLAEHLYSSPKVGVRELIQNAHDSCIRRSLEGNDPNYRSRIDVQIEPTGRKLIISDNGSGLTRSEIDEFLTVIGRGYTRELRDRLEADFSENHRLLIGQFGIGFLSAYLLADSVVFHTRSQNDTAWTWRSFGDHDFEITTGERDAIGTTIELHLKPSALFLLREDVLKSIIQRYADFLLTPIYFHDDPQPINIGTYPWDDKYPESACKEYIRRHFGEAEPLWILPLKDGHFDLGHDSISTPLKGFLFVPSQSTASVREFGEVSVFIRAMAICASQKDLLPTWARFVQGVVECPAFQPTASREAVHEDEVFCAVKQILAEQLAIGLEDLAANDPVRWLRIVESHRDLILGWSAKDPAFFDLVAEVVSLPTSRGSLTLPAYLRVSKGQVWYSTCELGSIQEKVLTGARNVPVIDGSWFGVVGFLSRYLKKHPELKAYRLDESLESLLRPAPLEIAERLLEMCQKLGYRAKAATFEPPSLPAVMIWSADAEIMRDLKSGLDQGFYPAGISDLFKGLVVGRQGEDCNGLLYLNLACPLIQHMATLALVDDRLELALSAIIQFARLLSGKMLDAEQATVALDIWQRSLFGLLEQ